LARHDVALRGFLSPSPRTPFELLDPAETVVSEAGPLPGSPVAQDGASKVAVKLSGGQAVPVDVVFVGAGFPGVDPLRSARAAWKRDSEAASEWRGWSPPTAPHTARAISFFTTANTFSNVDIAVIPSTQTAVVLSSEQSGATLTGPRTQTLDPATWTLTDNGPARPLTGTEAARSSCLVVAPDEALLLIEYATTTTPAPGYNFWTTSESRDNGASFAVASRNPIPIDTGTLLSSEILRGAMVGNNVLLVQVGYNGATQTLRQYTSTSLAARFTQVGADWVSATGPQFINLAPFRSGRCAVVYFDGTDVIFKSLGSSGQSIETAVPKVIEAGVPSCDGIAMEIDADDSIWVRFFAAGVSHTHLWVSYDGGELWRDALIDQDLRGPWNQGESASYLRFRAGACAGGRHLTLCNSVDSAGGANHGGVAMLQLWGGWANAEILGANEATRGNNWIPVQLPESTIPWTVSGTGTFVLASPGYGLYTTAGDTRRHQYASVWGGAKHDIMADFEIDVLPGAAIDTIGWLGLQSDGAQSVAFAVSVSNTQINIVDNVTPGTPVAHGITGILQVAWWYDSSTDQITVWYRDSASPGNWTKSHAAVQLTPFALVAVGVLIRGHFANVAGSSRWYGHNVGWSSVAGSYGPAAAQLDLVGRPLSATPYPMGEVGTAGAAAFLAAEGGPAKRLELWDIEPNHSHALERSFPARNRSPTEPWRTLTVADPLVDPVPDQILAWDFGIDSILGDGSFGLALLGTNARTAEVYGDKGGGDVLLGTYDGTITVNYVRDGDVLTADTGRDGGRYWFRGEFNGAEIDLGGGAMRIIEEHNEGIWDASKPTARQVRVFIKDATGTEPNSGTMTIIPRNGILVVHGHDAVKYQRYKVLLPSAITATGYRELGAHVFGPVSVVGKQWSEGWAWGRAPNATTHVDGKGTVTVEEKGVAPKTLTIGYTHITNHCGLRSGDPDHLAADTGNALATRDDIGWWFFAMLDEWHSGQTAIVALTTIPKTSGVTVTDVSTWLYCFLATAVGIDNVTGDTDGAANRKEVQRHPSITLQGIV